MERSGLYSEGGLDCPTAEGKANLLPVRLGTPKREGMQRLTFHTYTGRTIEQFDTRTKTGIISILDALGPEARVDLSPKDALKLQVKSGDRIVLSSIRGRIEDAIVKVSQTIREGDLFVLFTSTNNLLTILPLRSSTQNHLNPTINSVPYTTTL